MKRLVTVAPDNTTGFRKHLEELAHCWPGPSRFIAVRTRGPEPLAEIVDAQPDLTIVGASNWIKRNHAILSEIPGRVGLLATSPLGQLEISGDDLANLNVFLDLLDRRAYHYLFVGSPELAAQLGREDVLPLPAPYRVASGPRGPKPLPPRRVVSILSDNARHKNTLNALAGVRRSRHTEELTVNGLPDEIYELALRFGLGKILRDVGTLSAPDYRAEIRRSRLVLHVSHSEGLCYGALEALDEGTPVLVTAAMPWFAHPDLTVASPTDPQEIAERIDRILALDEAGHRALSLECRGIAERTARRNNAAVATTLKRLLA